MPLPGTPEHNRLTATERAVVDAIHSDLGWVTSAWIAEKTGQQHMHTRITLLRLVRAGVVRTAVDGADNTTAIYSCCGS